MKNRILKLMFFSAGSFVLFTLQGCITTESFGSGRGAGAKHKGTWRHEHKATINNYDIANISANSIVNEVYEPIIVSSEITEVISQPPTDIYVVKSGDVLSQIALDFDTTTATLIELNNLSNPDLLTVGQEVKVPVNSSTFKKVKSQKISQNIKKGGSKVTEGEISSSSDVRIIRDGAIIYTGKVSTIFREKNQVKQVSGGQECGITVKDYMDFQKNDTIEAFSVTSTERSI